MRRALPAVAAALAVALLAGCGAAARQESADGLAEALASSDLEAMEVEVTRDGDGLEGRELAVLVYQDIPTTSTEQVETVLRLATPYAGEFDTFAVSVVQGQPGSGDYTRVPLDEIGAELDLHVDTGTVMDTLYAPPDVLAERYGD